MRRAWLFFLKEEDFPHEEISKSPFENDFFYFWKTKLMACG